MFLFLQLHRYLNHLRRHLNHHYLHFEANLKNLHRHPRL
jgi:hypothetical protein